MSQPRSEQWKPEGAWVERALLGFVRARVGVSAGIVLMTLDHEGPTMMQQLSVKVGVRKPVVTDLVDCLVRRKLVTRERLTNDRRETWVVLTETGRGLVRRIVKGEG